jgi:hypothetical protein
VEHYFDYEFSSGESYKNCRRNFLVKIHFSFPLSIEITYTHRSGEKSDALTLQFIDYFLSHSAKIIKA